MWLNIDRFMAFWSTSLQNSMPGQTSVPVTPLPPAHSQPTASLQCSSPVTPLPLVKRPNSQSVSSLASTSSLLIDLCDRSPKSSPSATRPLKRKQSTKIKSEPPSDVIVLSSDSSDSKLGISASQRKIS